MQDKLDQPTKVGRVHQRRFLMLFQTRKRPFVGLAGVLTLLLTALAMPAHQAAAQTTQAAAPNINGAVHFIQTATTSNVTVTYLNNPATNNKPNALLFVT